MVSAHLVYPIVYVLFEDVVLLFSINLLKDICKNGEAFCILMLFPSLNINSPFLFNFLYLKKKHMG